MYGSICMHAEQEESFFAVFELPLSSFSKGDPRRGGRGCLFLVAEMAEEGIAR